MAVFCTVQGALYALIKLCMYRAYVLHYHLQCICYLWVHV